MAADIAFVHPGRKRNGKKRERKRKPWHVEMADVELRRRYRFSKANILFILRLIKKTTCQSTQRSNPISAKLRVNPQNTVFHQLRVNPQNTVFHQTFIVKCHLSSVKTKVVLLSDRSDVMELPSLVAKCGWHTSLESSIVLLLCYFFLFFLYTYR